MTDHSTRSTSALGPGRHRARLGRIGRWILHRVGRRLHWVLVGLAIVHLVGTLRPVADGDHQLEPHPSIVITSG